MYTSDVDELIDVTEKDGSCVRNYLTIESFARRMKRSTLDSTSIIRSIEHHFDYTVPYHEFIIFSCIRDDGKTYYIRTDRQAEYNKSNGPFEGSGEIIRLASGNQARSTINAVILSINLRENFIDHDNSTHRAIFTYPENESRPQLYEVLDILLKIIDPIDGLGRYDFLISNDVFRFHPENHRDS